MLSKLRQVLASALLLVAVAIAHRVLQGPLAQALSRPVPIEIPSKANALRLVTWNVRNFPDESEEAHLAGWLAALDADVVALQELRDTKAATRLLPHHELHVSRGGGRGGQHVAIAFDPRVIERVAGPFEHPAISMGGRVRPALSARLRHRATSKPFDVVVVHLKATARGHQLRRSQWVHLREIAGHRDSTAMFVMGDFNVTGPSGQSPQSELIALEDALNEVGLRRIPVVGACTAYWDGSRRDAWQEPSMLDLVWMREDTHLSWQEPQAYPWGPCARYACQAFRSLPAHPDPDLLRGSDHCPVSVDVPLADGRIVRRDVVTRQP